MKAFLQPNTNSRHPRARIQGLALVFVFSMLPSLIHCQDQVLATLSVNGASVAELPGLEADGSLWFESTDLRPFLEGRVQPAILDSLFSTTTRIGTEDLISAGMDGYWDPLKLVFALKIPVYLSPVRVFTVARKPGPLTGDTVRPEPFSAILNFSGRLGYTMDEAAHDVPVAASSGLFLNLHGWVLELSGSGTYENGSTSLSLDQARVVKDFVAADSRLSAGLLDSPATGLQASHRLLGLSMQRKSFLATRRLSAGAMGELVVEEGATARVFLNGSLIRSERLDPGVYRVAELPLSTGINQLEIELDGSGGQPSRFVHVQPYDDSFLGAGGLDYALAFGFEEDKPNRALGTAFIRFGMIDEIDAGISFQAGFGSALWGGFVAMATRLGNFSTDAGISIPTNEEAYPPGYAVTARYRLGFPGRPYLPALGLLLNYSSEGFTAPRRAFAPDPPPETLRLAASVSLALPGSVSAAVSLENRRNLDDLTDATTAAISLQRRMGEGLTMSGIGTLEARSDGSVNPSLTVSVLSAPARSRQSFQYSQGLVHQNSSFDISGNLGKGSYLEASLRGRNILGQDDESTSLAAQSRLRLPYGDLGARVSWEYDPMTGLPAGSLVASYSGALVFAGGLASLSRSVPDSFVLLAPRSSLEAETVSLQLGSAGSGLQSREGKAGVGLLPSYRAIQAYVELPDAPAEIVADRPFVVLSPGYRSGTVVRPGARSSLGFAGRLLDPEGRPVSWALGTLIAGNQAAGIEPPRDTGLDQGFTDGDGRFEFFGLEPGIYYVEWATKPGYTMEVELIEDEGLMVELGDFYIGKPIEEAVK